MPYLKPRPRVLCAAAGSDQEEDNNVSLAQRKRFTRVEMARVLMERNQVRNENQHQCDAMPFG